MVSLFNILAANYSTSNNSQRGHYLPGAGEDCGACESQHTATLFLPVSVLTPQ